MRQVVITLLWAVYWTRSERVRATFGAAALDPTARPILRSARATTAVAPTPRRRGLILRIAAMVFGVVVILTGIGLWASRVRPYFVPAGVDIRTRVAGRWDWTNRGSPCGDSAHVIAFTGDGKQMTITQQNRWVDSLGRDRTTSTYDIQSVTRSTIRGAIRGEERRTPDGLPVVWDLVLVSPDEYRWRRTDWSTSWSYTAPVVRCDPSAPRRATAG
jgi:hypothetical protein